MKRTVCIILSLFLGAGVKADSKENLACCPSSAYILSDLCYDPGKNVTTSMKLDCVMTYKVSNFNVLANNIEIISSDNTKSILPSDKACHGIIAKDRNLTRVKPIALLCVTKHEEEVIIEDETLGYCMIASVVFLAITAITYAAFKELRDLFGKSIINFCTSLAIGLGILAILKLMPYRNMTSCAIRGFLAYFFLLAAFFWTNSISIQVLRDTRRSCSVLDYGWREFRWYALYSWGVPTVLTTCMAIVNYHPGDHQRPGIGLSHCWFLDKEQQWYYMYSVMTILLIANIGIFIYIATMVWRHSFSSTHIQALKFKLSMTVRLIVLMGLPWIFEMISSAAGNVHIIWAIVDVFNSLQGILVFLILVLFRKRVIKVIHKRGWFICCSNQVDKYLAVGDDAEENVVQHTDVPMSEDYRNGNMKH